MELNVQLLIDALDDYKQWYTFEGADEDDRAKVNEIDAELQKLYGVEKIEI